ncbi:hypothetical protein D1647_20390 [Alistipes sp. Z76]|nr:hypothetical protein [Alistipes sp. Z76]NCE70521.1 hypothetical protein [Muribaculaceae bacterium M3]
MTNKNENWVRLESVIRWANMTTNYFGRYIGLARSENLYQIKAGKNGISQNLARRIVEKFPELSVGWLLTGEGDMFSKGSTNGRIPFFDCDVVGRGLLRLDEIKPDYRMNIPTIEDCDYAFRSYDVAMSNEIAVGSILFLKKTAVEAIIPGGMYVVICPKYIILRKVRLITSADGSLTLVLEPANAGFDSITVKLDDVKEIYRVVANLQLY